MRPVRHNAMPARARAAAADDLRGFSLCVRTVPLGWRLRRMAARRDGAGYPPATAAQNGNFDKNNPFLKEKH
jgi:hypothetical protein